MLRSKQAYLLTFALILTGMLTGCGSNTPSSTVETFFRAVESGDIDNAIDQLSTQIIGLAGEQKLRVTLAEGTQDLANSNGIASIETGETVNGDVAQVAFTVTYGDGSADSDSMDLIKEDGDWKIQLTK